MPSLSSPRFLFRGLCAVLALLAAAAVAGLVAPPGAAAVAPLRHGSGYHLPAGEFVGYYLTRDGVKVFCIDPGKKAPTSVSLSTIARYPGMSKRTADELAYALSTWGDPTTKVQAAAESQLVNTVVGHAAAVRRRGTHLPRAVTTLVAAHLRSVRALAGPYTVLLRAPRAVGPGQVATGSVAVAAAGGRKVPGVIVRLQGSANVTVPAALRTGAGGSAAFRYTVTGPGTVRITATAGGLAPSRFTGTHPASGSQRMVTGAPATTASAHTGFEARPGAFTHTYACTTTCDGRPLATLRACSAAGGYPARLTYRWGAQSRVVDFPAAARGRCLTTSLVLADRDQVRAVWTYLGPHGWTAPVAAGGAFVVDCPAVPAVEVALSYDCAHASLAVSVTAPATHPAVLLVSGATVRRVGAPAGGTARFATTVPCGTPQTFTVRAGVQRSGGGWNYGSVARIGTPSAAGQP